LVGRRLVRELKGGVAQLMRSVGVVQIADLFNRKAKTTPQMNDTRGAIARVFARVKSKALRRRIVELVQEIVRSSGE